VDAIQAHIESIPSANLISNTDAALKVAELEAEISVFRGDLKARDESNAELRTSLKEAVALLKPLQDAVNKSEQEKKQLQEELDAASKRPDDLQQELTNRDEKIQDLQQQVSALEEDLAEAQSPGSPERTSRSLQPTSEEGSETPSQKRNSGGDVSPTTLAKAREDLKAKRESERALQQMLRNAQGRFHALHKENHDVEAQNHELRDRIKELEEELERLEVDHEETIRRNVAAEMNEGTVRQLEQETKGYQEVLQRKEEEVIRLEEELALVKDKLSKYEKATEQMRAEIEELQDTKDRIEEIEGELSAAKGDLEAHKEAETVLAKSLKQAVGLLRPLETHLETAEQEKRDLHRELKACRKRLAKLESTDSESRSRALSLPNEVEMQHSRDLEGTVRELEQENDKLQHALEEVSQNRSLEEGENDRSQVRLKENLVEVNSRYEVTQSKLERAVVENSALIDALKHKEDEERKAEAERRDLREELMRTNQQLENAKYIATSALVKVEELTMQNVADMSFSQHGEHLALSKDYAHMSPPQKLLMQERVRTIEKEVEQASRANQQLVGSLEDRERIVQSLTSTPQSSGETATAPPQPTIQKEQQSARRMQVPHPTGYGSKSPPKSTGPRRPRRPSELPPWASPDDYD
jgi:chromosome segregation ATPase